MLFIDASRPLPCRIELPYDYAAFCKRYALRCLFVNVIQAVGSAQVAVPTINSTSGAVSTSTMTLEAQTIFNIWGVKPTVAPKQLLLMFKYVYLILGCISMLHVLFTDASALEIMSPTEGQTVEIGSTLHVVVKPQQGEKFTEVIAGLETIPYDASTP